MENTLKFIDLTTIGAVLEVQIEALTQHIEEVDNEERKKLFKTELTKLKNTNKKIKKMINDY